MKLPCFLLLLAFVVAMPTSESRTNSLTTYWSSQFQGVLMPPSIKDYLPAREDKIGSSEFVTNDPSIIEDVNIHGCKPPPYGVQVRINMDKNSTSLQFLEKDLWTNNNNNNNNNNKKVYLYPHFPLHLGKAHFIPRTTVEQFPTLKVANVPLILSRLSINSNETKATSVIKHSIETCEYASKDENVCVTSLESMVDFVQSTLALNKGQVQGQDQGQGRIIRAYSTSLPPKYTYLSPTPTKSELLLHMQPYRIVNVKRLSNSGDVNSAISCHKVEFPFAVFMCHQRPSTVPYMVTLEGMRDKTRFEAATACHMDTSDWDPQFPSLVALKATPGTPICHFLNQVSVLWVAS